jgi:hypothetical protein
MSRRPRTQAVPQSEAGSRRSARRTSTSSRAGGAEGGGIGCGWLVIIGTGMVLVIVGLASVIATPPPEPTPSPDAGPLPIVFGYAIDPNTHLVTQPGSEFEHGDPFAYSVNPPTPPGVPQVYVAIVQRQAGEEVVLQPPTAQALRPNAVTFGYEVRADDLIRAFGYGRFIMRISLSADGAVYAQGRFELVEPSVPQ